MKEFSITCVVIGLNTERTICECLESVKKQQDVFIKEIIYVDGGSKDKSIEIAKKVNDVKVIELCLNKPTPGKGRNVGWRIATGDWIHFFDSDTVVDKGWISKAIKRVDGKTAAIFGLRKEKRPHKNYFHFIADLEWPKPGSKAKFFGGDVLIKHSVLEETGGYDESLIAGEDPELSVRIRNKGWKIIGVDDFMCYHDINMKDIRQYFRRAFRGGYAYASAGIKMAKIGENVWLLEIIKIFIKAILVISLIFVSIFYRIYIVAPLILFVFFFPLIKISSFKKRLKVNIKEALIYAFHCSVIIWPQLFGAAAYYFKRLNCFVGKK